MKVDGNEFLRNVSLEQDKDKLKREQEKLEKKKTDAVKSDDFFNSANNSIDLNLSFDNNQSPSQEPMDDYNHLNDIKLNPDSNEDNKKKYLVLGLALILLFIITIVVVRVLSNNEQEDKLIENQEPKTQLEYIEKTPKDEELDKIETEEEYEKIIEQKDQYENKQIESSKPTAMKKDIILPEPVKEAPPVQIDAEPKEAPKRDLFGLENEVAQQETKKIEPAKKVVEKKVNPVVQKKPEPVIYSQPKRKVVIQEPKETNFTKKTTKVSGYYIQIGSFSKKPSVNYLKNIKNKGYSYTVHPMNIKGKIYNKVLVGAYPTRDVAKSKLSKVRRDFKVPGAYILKF